MKSHRIPQCLPPSTLVFIRNPIELTKQIYCRRPTWPSTCRNMRTGQTRGHPSSLDQAWVRSCGPRWTQVCIKAMLTDWTPMVRVWWITGFISSLRRTCDTREPMPWEQAEAGVTHARLHPHSLLSTPEFYQPRVGSTWEEPELEQDTHSTTQYPFNDRVR